MTLNDVKEGKRVKIIGFTLDDYSLIKLKAFGMKIGEYITVEKCGKTMIVSKGGKLLAVYGTVAKGVNVEL